MDTTAACESEKKIVQIQFALVARATLALAVSMFGRQRSQQLSASQVTRESSKGRHFRRLHAAAKASKFSHNGAAAALLTLVFLLLLLQLLLTPKTTTTWRRPPKGKEKIRWIMSLCVLFCALGGRLFVCLFSSRRVMWWPPLLPATCTISFHNLIPLLVPLLLISCLRVFFFFFILASKTPLLPLRLVNLCSSWRCFDERRRRRPTSLKRLHYSITVLEYYKQQTHHIASL